MVWTIPYIFRYFTLVHFRLIAEHKFTIAQMIQKHKRLLVDRQRTFLNGFKEYFQVRLLLGQKSSYRANRVRV